MSQEKQKTKNNLTIIALIALIAALTLGVYFIFEGLTATLSLDAQKKTYVLQTENGQNSDYSLRLFDQDGDQSMEDATQWQTQAQQGDGQQAHWLVREEEEEFLLYLPMENRTLTDQDITATEEKNDDGAYTLVIRVRTAEDSQEIDPTEQIFVLRSTSERWQAGQVKVIVDGRDIVVYDTLSRNGKLYGQYG